mgnify:FL=1
MALTERISAACGRKKAELVLKHAKIVHVFTETIEEGDVAVEDGVIVGIGAYDGVQEIDLEGKYVAPGLIDGHIHLESSMASPEEFARMVVPHGTAVVVTDPHEIVNVAGTAGIRYMLEATEGLDLDVYFMMPSCVPSTGLDEAGAVLHAADLEPFYENPRVLGLAEMMNSYGVVAGDEGCVEKLEVTRNHGKLIDGHAPMLSGKGLNAYVAAGVQSDHECSTFEEAKEKFARGQWIMVRQGTAAKNLEKLMPMFEAPYYQRAMLVTDDKHAGELGRDGHIDSIIRKAVKLGADPVRAVKMGSLNAAEYFGLKGMGAVAPGYQADLVIFEDLKDFQVKQVYRGGKLVAEDGKLVTDRAEKERSQKVWDEEIQSRVFHSFHMKPIEKKDLELPKTGSKVRVIDLMDHELTTGERIEEFRETPGLAPGVDLEKDIVKIAVFERHHGSGHVGLGFLGNYGLKRGAVATSVGHDSHNLVVAGVCDEDMIAVGNRVLENEGGLAIAVDGKVVGELALTVAGLMSDLPAEEADRKLEEMKAKLGELGIRDGIDGFMTLAFVSLPVIPAIRVNTLGIVDVERQEIVDAVIE